MESLRSPRGSPKSSSSQPSRSPRGSPKSSSSQPSRSPRGSPKSSSSQPSRSPSGSPMSRSPSGSPTSSSPSGSQTTSSSQSSSGSSQSSSGSSQSSYIAEIEPRLNLSVEEQGHVYNGAADLELWNSGDSLDSPECSPPGDAGGEISPRRSVTTPKPELVFSPLSRGSYAASQNENSPKPRLTPRQPNLQPMQPLRKRNRPLPEVCLLNILFSERSEAD